MNYINYQVPYCEVPYSPNIRLRILFANILSLRSSLNVGNHDSQLNSTTGNDIVLYISIFKFLEKKHEDKRAWSA